jgi:tetratricopeptide (TPR) repeat protein
VIAAASAGAQQTPDALELYRQGRYEQAVQVCLQELQDRGPDQSRRRMDSFTVLGWSYIRLGQYQNALTSARQARSEVRYDIRIIEIEAEALYFLGRNLEALSLFEEYVSLSPTGERIDVVYYFMGEIFLRLAEYRHADIAFSTAIHHSPQIARWWARLGYAREQISDSAGAMEAYTAALKLDPSLEDARVGLERVSG